MLCTFLLVIAFSAALLHQKAGMPRIIIKNTVALSHTLNATKSAPWIGGVVYGERR